MPPPLRNHRTPMLGNTPASTAAFSLEAPRAIASQNRTRCSLRPAGGCPPQRVPAAAARFHARLFLAMTTPQRQALRQPIESTPTSPGHTELDPPHPTDTPPGSAPNPSDQPHREPSRQGDARAATPPTTAASTTTGRAHTKRNLEPYQGVS